MAIIILFVIKITILIVILLAIKILIVIILAIKILIVFMQSIFIKFLITLSNLIKNFNRLIEYTITIKILIVIFNLILPKSERESLKLLLFLISNVNFLLFAVSEDEKLITEFWWFIKNSTIATASTWSSAIMSQFLRWWNSTRPMTQSPPLVCSTMIRFAHYLITYQNSNLPMLSILSYRLKTIISVWVDKLETLRVSMVKCDAEIVEFSSF